MTDSNNSGNNSSNTCATQGQSGQVITTNGNWISIPINSATAGGNCAGAWVPPSQTYTIVIGGGGGGGSGQISFDDIDLAVPVEEKKEKSDGCSCKKCKEFYQYAEPNQDDGTLICYGCRMVW